MIRTLIHPGNASAQRRGTSLVVTTILVFSLAGISISLTAMSRSSATENRAVRDETNAYYVAQAGLAQAVQDLRAGGNGAVGSQQTRQDFGGASFWVDSVNLGGGFRSLVATGVDQRAGARIELVMQQTNMPFFRYGAFGDVGLTLHSNASIDSYDSTLGSYESQVPGTEGDTGSNGNITLRQNSTISGSAQPGPDGTVTILGNAVVSGTTFPAQTVFDMPAIDFPAEPGDTDYTVVGARTLLPGLHQIDDLRLSSSSILTVIGPATIVCSSMELRSNSHIIVNAEDGPVEFYVQGDFKLLSNSQIYSTTHQPSDVVLYLNGDNIIDPDTDVEVDPDGTDELLFNSNTRVYGLMYAPNAFVNINSNFQLFGALIARRLHLDSFASIHYDEALRTMIEDSEIQLQAILWRRRPFSMSELAQ